MNTSWSDMVPDIWLVAGLVVGLVSAGFGFLFLLVWPDFPMSDIFLSFGICLAAFSHFIRKAKKEQEDDAPF